MGVQALYMATSVSNVPFPVVVDLAFGDAGLLLTRRVGRPAVAASKDGRRSRCKGKLPCGVSGQKQNVCIEGIPLRKFAHPESMELGGLKSGLRERKRIVRVSNSWICRANSFDQEGYGPESEDVEYFSRMNMALEASRRANSRAASTSIASFFEGSSLHAACEPARPSSGHGVEAATPPPEQVPLSCAQGGGLQQLPSSIKKLRRRKGESAARESAGCAIRRAFASMVYMIKAVQSHALQIRQVMFAETWDAQEVLHLVHKEMHSSFVWLFQRVFACTPKLMVSVMILLANFTVFSMGENLAIATVVTDTPPSISHFLTTHGKNPQTHTVSSPQPKVMSKLGFSGESMASPGAAGSGGNNFRVPGALVAEEFDDDSGAMKLEQVQLAQEISTRKLVAPHLESDNYGCYDRTDLDYQLAIAKDPLSPVLLANYAQFLFVVRRDHNRAEEYFHRAMEADPRDSTLLDRFASFLWLGRGDRSAAERVYKAAMAADPESSYSAGSYAHFLWHAGDGDGRMAS